jgi:8-oxo-dGTP pyrophosphatase MutT (NUDIX family)
MREMFVRLLYFCFRIFTFIFRPVRVGTRVMLIQDDKVLLIRHTYLHGWYMPGGGLKRGETLEQAARREAHEEAGAELRELKLLGAYTSFKDYKTDHNILFLCRDFTLNGRHDSEIAEAHFFALNDLPDDMPAGHRRRLQEYRDGIESIQVGEW